MFFSKYHIVILKHSGASGSRKFHMRAWIVWILFLLFVGLASANYFLFKEYIANSTLQSKLTQSEKIIDEQNTQLLSMADKLRNISDNVKRVERFDAKLRQMMDVDANLEETSTRASRREDFFRGELPLHRPSLAARRIQTFLRQLSEDVIYEEVVQQELLRTLRAKKNTLLATPSIWPAQGFISSHFGMRNSPFGRGRAFHKGLDINARTGTPIVATAEGTVKQSGYDGAYGISVEIDHGRGIITKYAHMKKSNVKVGQWVRRGDTIGTIGMTGRTTGPHVHYEVRVGGTPVNPMKYILE